MGGFKQIMQAWLVMVFFVGFGVSSAQTTGTPDRGPISLADYDRDGNGLVSKEIDRFSNQTVLSNIIRHPAIDESRSVHG